MTCVLSERNIAPARPQWGKYSVFQRAGAKNISRHPTTPHAGAVFFTPAPPLPHRREKTHPARLHHRPGGTKFTQHAQNAPKRAISSEQGEFCTAHAVRRGLLGEFCPAHAVRRGLPGEFCTGSGPARSLAASIASPRHRPHLQLSTSRHPRTPQPGPSHPSGAHRTGGSGGLAALDAGWRRVAGVSHP